MLAKEGYPTIGVVIAFSVIVGWLLSGVDHWVSYLIYGVLAALCLLVIYFFRDPERRSPADPNLILSPADGRVVLVRPAVEESYLDGEVTQVIIFVFPLDVDVNRLLLSEILGYVEYCPVAASF